MTQQPRGKTWEMMAQRGDIIFSIALLSIVVILVLPLPSVLLDLLLSTSLALSILIILTVSYVKQPSDFFVFPSILLFVTLFRLGLNVATTRSILINGEAGNLIAAFGQFVVGGNVVVGLIVFIILTIINFVVITKGAGRVAEVSARFTLDALPGKQMSIDADLNAGVISEKEARARRTALEREASFYGAMDGASKFVRGEAVAGILITAVNLIGGFVIGILQMGLTAEASAAKFSLLSVGDGLVAQFPSLLISTAAGVLVTRSSSKTGLGEDVTRQIFSSSRAVLATGVALMLLMFVPGFPVPVLFILGAFLMFLSYILPKGDESVQKEEAAQKEVDTKKAAAKQKDEFVSEPEALSLELGLNLLPLVHGNVQNLLERLSSLRKSLSRELGIVIPSISVRDNSSLPPHQYRILLRGHQVALSELFPGQFMAMGVGNTQRPLKGRVTTEPAFGLPATWIMESERKEAERLGFAVVDPLSILITHFSEILKNNVADLLTRQEVQRLIDSIKVNHSALIQEMTSVQLSIGIVHRVMQNLLRENISVRELPVILERLCDQISTTKNPDELSESCRKMLSLEITRHLELQKGGVLKAITLHPELEQVLAKCVRQTAQEQLIVMEPSISRHLHEQISGGIETLARQGISPVVVCSAPIRLPLRKYFSGAFSLLRFVAYQELPPKLDIQTAYAVHMPPRAQAA